MTKQEAFVLIWDSRKTLALIYAGVLRGIGSRACILLPLAIASGQNAAQE